MAEPKEQTGKAKTEGKVTGKAANDKQQISAETKAKAEAEAKEPEDKPYKDGGKRVAGKLRIRLLYKYGFYPAGALIYVDEAVGRSMIEGETAKEVK